jgi:pimeloyl-ACP methyl ester carboxylesterase
MKWLKRALLALLALVVFILFVVMPVGGSFLITNSHFRFPEPGPTRPEDFGLSVENVEFTTGDGKTLRGWWNPGEAGQPVVLFCHGLNRSRGEMLDRAAETRRRGYGVLLFDFRDHGVSDPAYRTLGIHETRDVCAASAFVQKNAPSRPQWLWGVSLGASTALLGANTCGGFSGVVSDSAFLSIRDTVSHHFNLIFRLPSWPIANAIVALTGWRMGMKIDDGDVEAAVKRLRDVPILFIAGGKDVRMPPAVARRLFDASANPSKQFLLVPEARHGEAFRTDRALYLDTVFGFFNKIRGGGVGK